MKMFTCAIDKEAESFCDDIADMMVNIFKIPKNEAIGRINEHWKKQKIGGPNELVYHENVDYWAKTIYYEDNTYWWRAEWMKENTPNPKPYPKQ